MEAVNKRNRIRATGDTWGTPISIDFCAPVHPSSRAAAFLSFKKDDTQRIRGSGIFSFYNLWIKRVFETLSNAPLISKANTVNMSLFANVFSMSWVKIAAASTADCPGIALKCKELINSFFNAIFDSLFATILSSLFPRHDSNDINLYDWGSDWFCFSDFGRAQKMAVLNTKGW